MNSLRYLRSRLLQLVVVVLIALWIAQLGHGQSPVGTLGEGQIWETPWYLVEGAEEGPTVLITGGVHGNEPAGAAAAEQIRKWSIQRGKLIVIPQVNRLGLTANTRWFPPNRNDKSRRDLNRNFPKTDDGQPIGRLAGDLWKFVNQLQPDLVVDLHEGFDFHRSNPKSVGSSVIFSPSEKRSRLGKRMWNAVNQQITDEDRKFDLLSGSGAVLGSLVRSSNDRLGIDAFILETTTRDQPLSTRTRQHRLMVSTLLAEIGMIEGSKVNILTDGSQNKIDVAIYDDAGVSKGGVGNLSRILGQADDVCYSVIGPADIQNGALDAFDLVLFPGGSGSKQGRSLGKSGREKVQSFVDQGGDIIGICAGAYLVSSHYDWSLHLINTSVYNDMVDIPNVGRKSMWYRGGPAKVALEVETNAKSQLGFEGSHTVQYQNGPIVSPGKNDQLPEYEVLAWFRSENWRYEAQKGTMVDTPAIITAPFGKGRVLSISPHPEGTKELESMILHSVRWMADQE